MPGSRPEPITDVVSELGECPTWDARDGALWWVDSHAPCLYRLDAAGGVRRWDMPEEIGSFALCEDGRVLCALRNRLLLLDPATGAIELFATTPNDAATCRLNDGKCDRQGRFWVGTFGTSPDAPDGALYRIDPDGRVVVAMRGFVNSNGLAFPVGTDSFYHSDSRSRVVYRLTPSRAPDTYARDVVFTTSSGEHPDGAAVDSEGHYWSALYGAGAVVRVSPDGREVARIAVPTVNPTMIAFGGPDLRTLYITTARYMTRGDLDENDVLAGRLFAVRLATPGLPEPRFSNM